MMGVPDSKKLDDPQVRHRALRSYQTTYYIDCW
jgi:hypothetical protein